VTSSTLSASRPDANSTADLGDARSVLGQAGAENFPVASRILPRAQRAHLMAIYGFARLTDDIGDEAPGDRARLLDELEAELDRAVDGTATHPLMRTLGVTIRQLDLALDPFRALIQANRQDLVVKRYERFEDLVAYCMLSAAPVGRLVLAVFGALTPERQARSDDVCIALQVIEHLQDVAEDLRQDRVYLPLADLRAYGCSVQDLAAPHASSALRRLVAFEAARARRMLMAGPPLAATLSGRPALAVCGFTAGGHAALDAVAAADYDVLGHQCTPRRSRFALRMARAIWRSMAERRSS
jgi:squalene synthase HpnC